ncbi:hypothetical protein C0993_009935, partial [Termitomyces sp. T159_Od127]
MPSAMITVPSPQRTLNPTSACSSSIPARPFTPSLLRHVTPIPTTPFSPSRTPRTSAPPIQVSLPTPVNSSLASMDSLLQGVTHFGVPAGSESITLSRSALTALLHRFGQSLTQDAAISLSAVPPSSSPQSGLATPVAYPSGAFQAPTGSTPSHDGTLQVPAGFTSSSGGLLTAPAGFTSSSGGFSSVDSLCNLGSLYSSSAASVHVAPALSNSVALPPADGVHTTLAGHLTVAPSIARSADPVSGSFSLAPSPRPFLAAPPTSSSELDPNIMPIPLHIQRVFNAGWTTYVPLDLLTNAACHRAMTASSRHGDSSLSLSSSGELQVSSSRFDLSRERHLTAYEFMQASKTLVWVIRFCLRAGPEGLVGGPTAHAIADSFEAHYDRIQRRHDFGEHFPVYLAYDIYIRHAYLQNGGSVSVHEWHKLVFEKKLQDFTTDCIRRTLNLPSDLLFGDGSASPFGHRRKRRRILAPGRVTHPAVSIGVLGEAPMITLPERPRKSGAWSVVGTITDLEVVPTQGASFVARTVVGQTRKESPTVSHSMGRNHVPQETVHTVMPVPSVETVSITRRRALLEEFCPVSTPLIVPAWEVALRACGALTQYAHVIHGLRFGFSLGLDSVLLDHTFSPPNHYKTPEHHEFIISKYAQEREL